jgi:hypothetical protein
LCDLLKQDHRWTVHLNKKGTPLEGISKNS